MACIDSGALLMSTESIQLQLEVNGAAREVAVSSGDRLLDVLRDRLGLTGTKEGCGQGECGACMVLMDGRLVNSCLVPAFQAHGRAVKTVEGYGRPGELSPIQRAMVDAGAVQCGYCTPGFVVTASSLVADGESRSREQIREALSGNICRCTGYRQLVDACESVQSGAAGALRSPPHRVGERAWKVDAEAKVAGTCRYTADIPPPAGCLHGVTVRAEHVRAELLGVDVEAALACPGVVRVLTWEDVPGELHYGNAEADQPVLVRDHIRFWGEAVAVVLAESPEAARRGAALVRVRADDLPPVLSPEAGLAPDAPLLHEGGNLLVDQRLHKGDVDAAMAGAEIVLERRYTTGAQETLCLEPEAALAVPGDDGSIEIFAPSQNVFFDRHHVCRTLGLDKKKVRVIQQPMGAAFGSREDIYAQIHAALGAHLTGRPTRIVWTREESQVATTKRHPGVMVYRAGVSAEGRIVALDIDVLFDTGAYASWAPNIARKALVHAAGTYAIDDVRVRVRSVYTNNGISGAFRGFGAPQVAFACESFISELAAAAGVEPVAFRRLNHLAVGRRTSTGQLVTGSIGLEACLLGAVVARDGGGAARGPAPPHIARGVGISTIFYGIGYGNAIRDIGSAILELKEDGCFELRCGAIDYGQGALTVFTQIACEVLSISPERLRVFTGDSQETPDSGSTVASRQTYISGEAVRQASDRLRGTLLKFAATASGRSPEELTLDERGVSLGEAPLFDLAGLQRACAEAGVRTRRQARFKATTTRLDLETGQGDAYWPYAFAAHVAEVEVDLRTGRVRPIALYAAHDVGRAINPQMVEGQIIGGATQGLGFALLEEHRLFDGVPRTLNLDTYRLPGAGDVPEIVPIIIEDPEPTGPFGAKGVGEPVLVAVAPAIANAVADAVGVRCRNLPIRPEVIRAGLLAAAADSAAPGGEA